MAKYMFWDKKTLVPQEQLEFVVHEIEREVLAVQTRTESMRVRATLLIGASGLLTAAPDKWVSPWQAITLAIGIVAAGFGLSALMPKTIDLADVRMGLDARLRADPYSALLNIYDAVAFEMASAGKIAEKMAERLRLGYVFIVLSWISSAVILFLKSLSLI
ncbi:UNVERIFIED_ORG: hypothetical protein J2X79_002039 [Arthrobacter globiformis]|nr:hypothetical protein [Arthrobacter globiformis]